jgi:hypothetical protein
VNHQPVSDQYQSQAVIHSCSALIIELPLFASMAISKSICGSSAKQSPLVDAGVLN